MLFSILIRRNFHFKSLVVSSSNPEVLQRQQFLLCREQKTVIASIHTTEKDASNQSIVLLIERLFFPQPNIFINYLGMSRNVHLIPILPAASWGPCHKVSTSSWQHGCLHSSMITEEHLLALFFEALSSNSLKIISPVSHNIYWLCTACKQRMTYLVALQTPYYVQFHKTVHHEYSVVLNTSPEAIKARCSQYLSLEWPGSISYRQ